MKLGWSQNELVTYVITLLSAGKKNFLFQTFAVFLLLYAVFWVIPGSLNFICGSFGTICLFHLHRQVRTCLCRYNRAFRDVGI